MSLSSPVEASPAVLRIDIVSDVVCPWCVIGYLQLRNALQQFDGTGGSEEKVTVDLHWQPFELNPNMPPEGQDLREHIAQKYGTPPGQGGGARARLQEAGASLGFEFNYADDMRMVNTFRAHQLLYWAAQHGLQTELKLALFEAFFTLGKDVSQTSVLVEVAANVGLAADDAEVLLSDQRYAQNIRNEQQRWLEQEVHAVPSFAFNQRYPVPGAQGESTFVRYIQRVLDRT